MTLDSSQMNVRRGDGGLPEAVGQTYYRYGLLVATNPVKVILMVTASFLFCCSPLYYLPLPGYLPQEYLTPAHNYSLPLSAEGHLVSLSPSPTPTPLWYQGAPVAYLLQVVVRSSVGPVVAGAVQPDLTVSDSYRGPLATVFDLHQTLSNYQLQRKRHHRYRSRDTAGFKQQNPPSAGGSKSNSDGSNNNTHDADEGSKLRNSASSSGDNVGVVRHKITKKHLPNKLEPGELTGNFSGDGPRNSNGIPPEETSNDSDDEILGMWLGNQCLLVEDVVKQHRGEGGAGGVLPHFNCLLLSPADLWARDKNEFLRDPHVLTTIKTLMASYESQSKVADILFGVPSSEIGLLKKAHPRVITYALTIALKTYNEEFVNGLKAELQRKYPLHQESQPHLHQIIHLYFPYRLSLWEVLIFLFYCCLFWSVWFSLRKIEILSSNVGVSLAVLVTLIASLCLAVGSCAFWGLKPLHTQGKYVYPVLAGLVGFENSMVLIRTVASTPNHLDVKIRVARGLAKEGWNITKYFLIMITVVTLSFFLFIPIVQEICIYGSIVLLCDLYMQLVFMTAVLSIDLQRRHDSGKNLKQEVLLSSRYGSGLRQGSIRTLNSDPHSATRTGIPNLHRRRAVAKASTGEDRVAPPSSYPTKAAHGIPKRLRITYFVTSKRMFQRMFICVFIGWIAWMVYTTSGLFDHWEQLGDNGPGLASLINSIKTKSILQFKDRAEGSDNMHRDFFEKRYDESIVDKLRDSKEIYEIESQHLLGKKKESGSQVTSDTFAHNLNSTLASKHHRNGNNKFGSADHGLSDSTSSNSPSSSSKYNDNQHGGSSTKDTPHTHISSHKNSNPHDSSSAKGSQKYDFSPTDNHHLDFGSIPPLKQGSNQDASQYLDVTFEHLRHRYPDVTDYLPETHWPTLFSYYNVTLRGQYISLLPPVLLSVPVSVEEALEVHHSADPNADLWKPPVEEDPASSLDTEGWWVSLMSGGIDSPDTGGGLHHSTTPPRRGGSRKTPLIPTSSGEMIVTGILAIPAVMVMVYLTVWLYRCVCSRHYAEWREQWWAGEQGEARAQIIGECVPVPLLGHTAEVECVCTDGAVVASACLAGTIRVWDPFTSECLLAIDRNTVKRRCTMPYSYDANHGHELDSPKLQCDHHYTQQNPGSICQLGSNGNEYEQQRECTSATASHPNLPELYPNSIRTDFTTMFNGNNSTGAQANTSGGRIGEASHVMDPAYQAGDNSEIAPSNAVHVEKTTESVDSSVSLTLSPVSDRTRVLAPSTYSGNSVPNAESCERDDVMYRDYNNARVNGGGDDTGGQQKLKSCSWQGGDMFRCSTNYNNSVQSSAGESIRRNYSSESLVPRKSSLDSLSKTSSNYLPVKYSQQCIQQQLNAQYQENSSGSPSSSVMQPLQHGQDYLHQQQQLIQQQQQVAVTAHPPVMRNPISKSHRRNLSAGNPPLYVGGVCDAGLSTNSNAPHKRVVAGRVTSDHCSNKEALPLITPPPPLVGATTTISSPPLTEPPTPDITNIASSGRKLQHGNSNTGTDYTNTRRSNKNARSSRNSDSKSSNGSRNVNISNSNDSLEDEDYRCSQAPSVWSLECQDGLVFAGCADGTIEIWDADTGHLKFMSSEVCNGGVTSLTVTGRRLVAARLTGTVDLYTVRVSSSNIGTTSTSAGTQPYRSDAWTQRRSSGSSYQCAKDADEAMSSTHSDLKYRKALRVSEERASNIP